MSSVTIRIPTPLRSFTGGADEVKVNGATVGDALKALGATHNGVLDRVLTPEGEVRQFVNIYLGSQNVRSLNGLVTPVVEGAVLSIVPAVAGGVR
jgi:molybdopterin converting factor small subunit